MEWPHLSFKKIFKGITSLATWEQIFQIWKWAFPSGWLENYILRFPFVLVWIKGITLIQQGFWINDIVPPNWWIFFIIYFSTRIERLQLFMSHWEMWISNSFTIWSWFGLQAYRSCDCNHMAYKCIQRMRTRFSDTGKVITPFHLWLLTLIKQNAVLTLPADSLKWRSWRPWNNSRYIGRLESKTPLQ